MHRGKLIFLKFFINKDENLRGFRLLLAYIIIDNEFLGTRSDKDNFEGIRNKRKFNHLETAPFHANKWRGKIGVVMQNIDTRNTSDVAKMKNIEKVLHM